ncbi:MAG: TRAP transporter substrate-binding protein [Hyphomicrobiaceae bacterium]|nr:TRAP transporter substrate-binding protein [Hyphomicrobiaceae bacterium]
MVTAWPKGLPGLGTGAESLAKRITEMSDGKLSVRVFAGGELVPPNQTFDAVQAGTAEMGHDIAGFHLGKHRAFTYFFGVPYGMSHAEHIAWLHHGGGQALWDELSAQFGVRSFAIGNIGTNIFGWFRKPILSVGDMQGLKMRMPGLGGDVIRKLGAQALVLPGGEIYTSLQTGTIDAAEFTGPANDLALGFHQAAPYVMYPGIHEAGPVQQVVINKQKYDTLTPSVRRIVDIACQAADEDMLAEYQWINSQAIRTMVDKHGVKFTRLPEDVLKALGKASGDVLLEERDKLDNLGKKIWDAYVKARSQMKAHTEVCAMAYYQARALDYPFPS